jgi:hypothetical protein
MGEDMVERSIRVPYFTKLAIGSELTADGVKITATVPTSPARVAIGADGQVKLVIDAALNRKGVEG